jgi:catalase
MLVVGSGARVLEASGIPAALASGDPDPGLLLVDDDDLKGSVKTFIAALARHRHFEREAEPPEV